MDVWSGPSNVVFPRRYHSLVQLKHNGNNSNNANSAANGGGANNNSSSGGGSKQSKKKGEKEGNTVYYGSQSQGWMYGDGLARMGGLSWMDVTTPPTTAVSASTSNSKRFSAREDKCRMYHLYQYLRGGNRQSECRFETYVR